MKTTGLGDVLYTLFKVVGINWVVYKLTKGNCNCGKRREYLNNLTTTTTTKLRRKL